MKRKNPPSNNLYWKHKFMQVLEAMYWHEGTFATDKWQEYGLTKTDEKKILAEFDKQLEFRQKLKK